MRLMSWWLILIFLVVGSNGEQECVAPAVGMEAGKILDSQITASTNGNTVTNARLNAPGCWCTSWPDDTTGWIQIDLGRLYRVCAVATQGNPGGNKDFLKEIKLGWSNDNVKWETSAEVITTGNTNCCDVRKNFIPVIYARYIRLYPLKWHVWACTRMEIYGQPWPEGPNALFTPTGLGKALAGHVVLSKYDTDVTGCMELCLVTEQCKSFNFSHQLKKCEVSGSTAGAHDLEDQKEFNYYVPPSFQTIYT